MGFERWQGVSSNFCPIYTYCFSCCCCYCCYCCAPSRMLCIVRPFLFFALRNVLYRKFHGINWKIRSSSRSCTFKLFIINCRFFCFEFGSFAFLYILATQNESTMKSAIWLVIYWRVVYTHKKINLKSIETSWCSPSSSMYWIQSKRVCISTFCSSFNFHYT